MATPQGQDLWLSKIWSRFINGKVACINMTHIHVYTHPLVFSIDKSKLNTHSINMICISMEICSLSIFCYSKSGNSATMHTCSFKQFKTHTFMFTSMFARMFAHWKCFVHLIVHSWTNDCTPFSPEHLTSPYKLWQISFLRRFSSRHDNHSSLGNPIASLHPLVRQLLIARRLSRLDRVSLIQSFLDFGKCCIRYLAIRINKYLWTIPHTKMNKSYYVRNHKLHLKSV